MKCLYVYTVNGDGKNVTEMMRKEELTAQGIYEEMQKSGDKRISISVGKGKSELGCELVEAGSPDPEFIHFMMDEFATNVNQLHFIED